MHTRHRRRLFRRVRQARAGVRPVFGLTGLVFGAIGVTVLVFLWSARGFGAPPLFFRLVGSFIAIAFIGVGVTSAVGAARGGFDLSEDLDELADGAREGRGSSGSRDTAPASGSYVCTSCGAPLAKGADVSPRGDVRCTYCGGWFNIHEAPGA